MRSIYDNTKIDGVIAMLNTTVTVLGTGGGVDTKGFNTAAIRLATSKTGAGLLVTDQISVIAVLEESNDDGVADAYAAANDNTGAQITCTALATVTAVLASARIEGLGLSNRKRYLRVKTKGGTTTAGVSAEAVTSVAVIELGRAYALSTTTTASNT